MRFPATPQLLQDKGFQRDCEGRNLSTGQGSAALHGKVGGTTWDAMQCSMGPPEVHEPPHVL